MGDQIYIQAGGMRVPVEPSGPELEVGWLPGTWVKYSTNPLTFSGAMGVVERSDGYGSLAGFLLTGSQHNPYVEKLSDIWTTDTRQRPGGDNRADMTAHDPTLAFEFDDVKQLQRVGTRIVTMAVTADMVVRCYVFKTEDTGGVPLAYAPGDRLYVSDDGLFTKESLPGKTYTGFGVIRAGRDVEGDFIIFTTLRAV